MVGLVLKVWFGRFRLVGLVSKVGFGRLGLVWFELVWFGMEFENCEIQGETCHAKLQLHRIYRSCIELN